MCDADDDLMMFHYKDDLPEEAMNIVGHIRGTVTDKSGQIISKSYGYTKNIVSNVIPDYINVTSIQRIKNGCFIRVFMYNKKIYTVTHHKLDYHNSKWGQFTFAQIYEMLDGPKQEILDLSEHYSFLLVHPSIQMASNEDIHDGYIMQLDGPKVSCLKQPDYITVDQANNILKGNSDDYDDKRLSDADSILINSSGKYYQIKSDAYVWRETLLGDYPNLLVRFIFLTSSADLPNSEYEKMFPYIPNDKAFELIRNQVISKTHYPSPCKNIPIIGKVNKLRNIALCFISASPKKIEATYYLKRFMQIRESLIDILERCQPDARFSKRANDIMTLSARFGNQTMTGVRKLIYKEYGGSLIKLFNEFSLF